MEDMPPSFKQWRVYIMLGDLAMASFILYHWQQLFGVKLVCSELCTVNDTFAAAAPARGVRTIGEAGETSMVSRSTLI